MKLNDVIHGFIVRSVKNLPEQKAAVYQMEYIKNGAELIWIDNKENNKLFSIAFKTLPSDDTGVFHILEHSVLGGSKKYPVKEPFLHMLKSSMNTFLNAMTFPDKTIYPVSSRNETDFMNLVEVYLDAVFCPAIYENPFIFYQEGWHYELENEEDSPVYKGVVYNEMKGAYSSVDMLIDNQMNCMLFPDSCYRFSSGGDPKKIPDLTYEKFLAAHREYYHPSNAKIYLDGDVPIDRVLALLDEQYLSNYEKSENSHEIHRQQPVSGQNMVDYYAIGEEEDTKEKVHMTFGKIACDFSERKKLMALTVLSSYLTGSNESPLKQAILRKGLAQDVFLVVADGIAQPYCYLRICNTEYERRGDIKKAVRETAERLIKEGLDKDELEAAINQLEFQVRDSSEPQGLERNISVLNSWLYNGEPLLYLENNTLFQALRDALSTDYYDSLLKELLLDDAHTSELYFLPSLTKNAEDFQEESDRLAAEKAAWSEQKLKDILKLNHELELWQSEPDSKEAIASLPSLSIDEISPNPELLATEHMVLGKTPVIFHSGRETDIIHFNLYFSLSDVQEERWGDVSFMTNLLGMLPTKAHSAYELQREIKRSIGFLDYNIVSFSVPEHTDRCKPYFIVTCSVLKKWLGKALSLVSEILNETVYEGEESGDLISEILMQGCESVRQGILENGHSFAFKRAASHIMASGMFMEKAEGYSYYNWLEQFSSDFENRIEDFQAYADIVQNTIFSSARMTISITADSMPEEFEALPQNLEKSHALPAPKYLTLALGNKPVKEMIQIPAGISYSAGANHLDRYGRKYSGALSVLSTILSYDYLWNEVRVKGGAYGSGCQTGAAGHISFYSYRDPAPLDSVDVYEKTESFVRAFCESDEPIEKYIISSIAANEPLHPLRDEALSADADVFSGISHADRIRIRSEMLHTKKEDLLAFGGLFQDMAGDSAVCIIGHPSVGKECRNEWKIFSL